VKHVALRDALLQSALLKRMQQHDGLQHRALQQHVLLLQKHLPN
jgi:hypothetical protein